MQLSPTPDNLRDPQHYQTFLPRYFQYYTQNSKIQASHPKEGDPSEIELRFQWVHRLSGIQRTTKHHFLSTLASYPYSPGLDHSLLRTSRDLFPELEAIFETTEILSGTQREDIARMEHIASIYLYCATRGDFTLWKNTLDNWDTLLFLDGKHIPPTRRWTQPSRGPYDIRESQTDTILSKDFFVIMDFVGRSIFNLTHFEDIEPFTPFPHSHTSPSLVHRLLEKKRVRVSSSVFYEKIIPFLVSHSDIEIISSKWPTLYNLDTGEILDTTSIDQSRLYSIVETLSRFGGKTDNPDILPYLMCQVLFEDPRFVDTFEDWAGREDITIDCDLTIFRKMILVGVQLMQKLQVSNNMPPSQFDEALNLLKILESTPESIYFKTFYIQLAAIFCMIPDKAWSNSITESRSAKNTPMKRNALTLISGRDKFAAFLFKKVGLSRKEIRTIVDSIPDMAIPPPAPTLSPS